MQTESIVSQPTFIIKTSFDCNLKCSYCYEGHRNGAERLTSTTAENLVIKSAKYVENTNVPVTFVWHGGEPLLLSKDFYKRTYNYQQSFGPSFHFRNMLQTNGLLLDDAFASFFVKSGFDVGVSLDGPKIIHDSQRLTKSGAPSFRDACAALTRIKEHNGSTGAVAIFTRNTLDHLDEFYDFFRDRKLSFRINPMLVLGRATEPTEKDLQVSPKEYGQALIYLFDRWVNEPKYTFGIDPFLNTVRSIIGGKSYVCTFAGRCHDFYKVFPNGDIFLCGKTDDGSPALGNINKDNLEQIFSSPQRRKYAFDKACVQETCGKCEHLDICHGGCTASASVSQNGGAGRDYYCEGYKMLFNHIKAVVPKDMIIASKVNQPTSYPL